MIAAAAIPTLDKLMIHGHEEDTIKLDAQIQTVPADFIVSSNAEILDISLRDVDSNFDAFSSGFEINMQKTS